MRKLSGRSSRRSTPARNLVPALVSACVASWLALPVGAQLIYQETFNTDGDGTRYTTEGRGVVPDSGAGGPALWAHNFDVTAIGKVVGVPATAAARRAALVWNHGLDPTMVTTNALELFDSTVKWLMAGRTNATILFSPPATGDGDLLLVQRLTDQGHTVIDDDTSVPPPATNTVHLVIQSSSGVPTPTRFTSYGVPLLSFNGPNHDDELTSSIGATTTFDPGDITIVATNHPAAGGKTGPFKWVTAEQPLDVIGNTIPDGATVIATYLIEDPNNPGVMVPRPILIVIDKGAQLLGGILSGQEGTGFFAGADMNEPTISNGTFNTITEPRSLTLKPVSVAGKQNVKLTVALAATDVDFEQDDFLRISIDVDGSGPADFTTLAEFRPPTPADKFFSDGTTRLNIRFKDVTYNIPAGATDLVVRFEAMSTFFNEIVGFDNVRIFSGSIAPAAPTLAIRRVGSNAAADFTGVLQSAASVGGPWADVPNNPTSPFSISPASQNAPQFFRARSP